MWANISAFKCNILVTQIAENTRFNLSNTGKKREFMKLKNEKRLKLVQTSNPSTAQFERRFGFVWIIMYDVKQNTFFLLF